MGAEDNQISPAEIMAALRKIDGHLTYLRGQFAKYEPLLSTFSTSGLLGMRRAAKAAREGKS